MGKIYHGNGWTTGFITPLSFSRGLGWGLIGGLTGTLVMDLVLMASFSAVGLPALTCFSIIGNTVAQFFSILSMDAARAIHIGIITHYIVGPMVGAIFGAGVVRVEALQINTLKKTTLWAILYVEVLSQPLLAATPILMRMTAPATLQWYSVSFVMHLIMALVLGSVVGRGLRLTAAINPG